MEIARGSKAFRPLRKRPQPILLVPLALVRQVNGPPLAHASFQGDLPILATQMEDLFFLLVILKLSPQPRLPPTRAFHIEGGTQASSRMSRLLFILSYAPVNASNPGAELLANLGPFCLSHLNKVLSPISLSRPLPPRYEGDGVVTADDPCHERWRF